MVAEVSFLRNLYPRGEAAEFRWSGAPTDRVYFVFYNPEEETIWWTGVVFKTSGAFAFQIPNDALIGTYRIKMWDSSHLKDVVVAEGTMEVTDQPVPTHPGMFSKHDFVAEVQKKGFIVTKGMPSWYPEIKDNIWVIDRGIHAVTYTLKSHWYGIRLFNLGKHNPPIDTDDVNFSFELTETFARQTIDKLPILAIPICLWLLDIGLDKLTPGHALYVYYIHLGASLAAEVVYKRLSPQPKRIDFAVTKDMAIGTYFLALGAEDSGCLKTGCPFKYYG